MASRCEICAHNLIFKTFCKMQVVISRNYFTGFFILCCFQIGYREILNETVTHLSYTEDTFGDQQQWVSMRAEFAPTKRMKTFQQVRFFV